MTVAAQPRRMHIWLRGICSDFDAGLVFVKLANIRHLRDVLFCYLLSGMPIYILEQCRWSRLVEYRLLPILYSGRFECEIGTNWTTIF